MSPGDRGSPVERGHMPLDIENVHILLQVEQEQIQKRTFTNWINAQLSKRTPSCLVSDLFNDFRDGSKLLDLLEVMSGQQLSREKGRGLFQHRSNIETALSFLKKKSIKLVNINIPDVIDGKPSIILGLIWTIIMQYHIEELASGLSFSSRQSSLESLASLDSHSTLSAHSRGSSPLGPRASPLHQHFRVSAKKALLLWVREQCQKAGCTLDVKDFKASWRSGVIFLAILYALRPDLVDLTKARTRTNRQNLEEAFRIAERELRIPRLLEPDDVDVRDPDEKSIMTYVSQFLQYSRDTPETEDMQMHFMTSPKSLSPVNLPSNFTPAIAASPLRQTTFNQKAQEVTCWLVQAYQELLEGWDSTEGESYAERYHVFQTFVVSFNEQRRPVMPLLTAMKRTTQLSDDQRNLRASWDSLAEKLREYKMELDLSLPAPLDTVGRWLLRAEGALAEEEEGPLDHSCAAEQAREKLDLLKTCLDEMPQHMKIFQKFQNVGEHGAILVPADKLEEIKRRFTSVRVTAKYHGIKLEYQEHQHTVMEILSQVNTKLRVWKRPYISQESVRVLLKDWHDFVVKQDLQTSLETALLKLNAVANKYTSKSALAADSEYIMDQVKDLEEGSAVTLEEVSRVKSIMGRVLSAWDSYCDSSSSLHAWLEGSASHAIGQRPEVTFESMTEWKARLAHVNEVGNFLIQHTDLTISQTLTDDLCKINLCWTEFIKITQFAVVSEPSRTTARSQDLHILFREATQILKEPVEAMSGSLRIYRKKIQFMMRKIKEVNMDSLSPSPECSAETLQKLKLALPEVMQTLAESEQMCVELLHVVSGLDGRLAELLLWETEARELYHILKEEERRAPPGQDPRPRVLISRGLQLEGQAVTEEQDLQVMVMNGQKNSPLQYLRASAMQDREAVGMLSSLGARRDRSHSPSEDQPPSKVFIQSKEYSETHSPQHHVVSLAEHVSQAFVPPQPDVKAQSKTPFQPQTQAQQARIPQIIVQEYTKKASTSPPLPYSYAQAVTQSRGQAQSPPEYRALPQKVVQRKKLSPPLTQNQPQTHKQPPGQQPPQQIASQQQIVPEPAGPPRPQPQPHGVTSGQAQHKAGPHQDPPAYLYGQPPAHLLTSPPSTTMSHIQPTAQTQEQPTTVIRAPSQTRSDNQHMTQTPPMISGQSQPSLSQMPDMSRVTQSQIKPLPQQNIQPQSPPDSPELQIKPPALAQAPPQAYTEAYAKAQALARNQFEEAKHCLQEHILAAINVFKDKDVSIEQSSVKEEALRTLDPELLKVFLRAAEGMEAFCTIPQQRDMEFFTQSVKSQWEACFSAEGSLAQAGQHLEALKELCDTLSPEDAHRLAQAQLRECEKRLAAIQRQFSGDVETLPSDTPGIHELGKDLSPNKETTVRSDKASVTGEVSQVIQKGVVEKKVIHKEIVKTVVTEENPAKAAFERYDTVKKALQDMMAKNERPQTDLTTDSISLKYLHTRLQEIQLSYQDSDALWSEFDHQCSLVGGGDVVDQDRAELMEQWRCQQSALQRRGISLRAALRQVDCTESQAVEFSERLGRFIREAKDITGFTLTNSNVLTDIKDLDESIQRELDQLSAFETSELDPRDRSLVTHVVEAHKTSLDELRQQVRKSEAAARALDRFLMSLRTVQQDICAVQSAPCGDVRVLQDGRSKLALIRQSVESLGDKAPQLDLLLKGARLSVTWDRAPASCLDMVSTLELRLEEADGGLASQQRSLQREQETRGLGLRKRTLLGELRKVQEAAEKQGLKEPTIPAVQHRLRFLSDLEGQLNSQRSEFQSLQQAHIHAQERGGDILEELETQWEDTQRAVTDRQEQCSILLELLKKFQSCRSKSSSTIQQAEQTVCEQASYMGKESLQRLIEKVQGIQEELSGLGPGMEDIRHVCMQLQSHLKKIPGCSETPFNTEADGLVDQWLDVTEKTDSYIDNLSVALEMWEKQLLFGVEMDTWAGSKLAQFAESHPFQNEQEVLTVTDEIQVHEENIKHFHNKTIEIQKLLKTPEAPLELQVIETQLRKKKNQVDELFSDVTDVFQELMAVRKHLSERMAQCQSALQTIQSSVAMLSMPGDHAQMQDLCEQLLDQEEQTSSILKEVGLLSSMASPQLMQFLSADCIRLRETISHSKDMIQRQREEVESDLVKVIKSESLSFEEWIQDLQLSLNECFESPGCRQDVETSIQKLSCFLASKDGEELLSQLREHVERGSQQLPPEQIAQFTDWLMEQGEELATFRTHCQSRHSQLDTVLSNLNSLQQKHNRFHTWLQGWEQKSPVGVQVNNLLQDLHRESEIVDVLGEMSSSLRRHGLRADNLLTDSDKLLQRYRNLEAKLQRQTETLRVLEETSNGFDTQSESARTWVRDQRQRLHHTKKDDCVVTAQDVLSFRPEGDSKMQDLRRQGLSLCEHQGLEENRRREVQQTVGDVEEEWRRVLQTAEETLKKAEMQSAIEGQLGDFRTQKENTNVWVQGQRRRLHSLASEAKPEDRIHTAQAILSSKPEGDSKLQDLKRQGQSLCEHQDLEEIRRREVQQAVCDVEEEWRRVLKAGKAALDLAGNQIAQEREMSEYVTHKENSLAWVRDHIQRVHSLDSQTQIDERINIAQSVLSSKPQGESKLHDLKRRSQRLCEHQDLEENRRLEVQQTVRDVEEEWRRVLQTAEEIVSKAQMQYSLSRQIESFHTLEESYRVWFKQQQHSALSLGTGTQGSQEQIQERLQRANAVLTSRTEGDSKLQDLRRECQSLCEHQDLEGNRRREIEQTVRDVEEEWRGVANNAEVANRLLKGALDRLASCQHQRQQAQTRLSELQHQTAELPSHFPWPGLGDRRQAVETARTLLDKIRNLAPALSVLRSQGQDMFQLTQDPSWTDSSWANMEECIPVLLKQLTDACVRMEEGIDIERHCTQLVEQHGAAQDWLREHVKCLGALPVDRRALHSYANNLKALLQTVHREEKEMQELDSVRDTLLSHCTPAGRDTLTLEVSHLNDLRTSSEREIRERLAGCETGLAELDERIAKKALGLSERAKAVQWELRSLDQALSYSEPEHSIAQLQQHWHSLKNCDRSLEGLNVKVHDLREAARSAAAEDELPADVMSIIESLSEQHSSLRARLNERQSCFSENIAGCLTSSIQALHQWNQSVSPQTAPSVQATLDEGVRYQQDLKEAFSSRDFLGECLKPDQLDILERNATETLRDTEARRTSLTKALMPVIGSSSSLEKQTDPSKATRDQTIDDEGWELKQTILGAHDVAVVTTSTDRAKPESIALLQKQLVCRTDESAGLVEAAICVVKESQTLPGGPTMQDIFSEIQGMSECGPTYLHDEMNPWQDTMTVLNTTQADIQTRLTRLVVKVLGCRNRTADLNSTAMALQVEEVEECRQAAQTLVNMFSQPGEAQTANREALDHIRAQLEAAVRDISDVVHCKETQMQLVTAMARHTQTARARMRKLAAELEVLTKSPMESISAESDGLRSFMQGMEEDGTVLGELSITLSKLSPHLNQADRDAAQIQQRAVQDEWRSLERAADKTFHHVNSHASESSCLLAEIASLHGRLETIGTALSSLQSPEVQWDSKRAQELMMVNAELIGAQQAYVHLQQHSKALAHSSQKTETKQIEQKLLRIEELLDLADQVSRQTVSSNNPIMSKIHKVMMNAFAWAKQTESDIEWRRRKLPLLPEEVHRQIKDLKKLQWEMATKQAQLEALVVEVQELLPELDQTDDVPMVQSSLVSLESLSRSTTEKLAKAVREMESGLQGREKMSEQIADLDLWVVGHLCREAFKKQKVEGLTSKDQNLRVGQIQETLGEAEKQVAISEALIMWSRDIASELTITENVLLYDKLTNLQEDIKCIISYEKASQKALEDLLQSRDASRRKGNFVEKSLREMLENVNRHRFPVTKESLHSVETFKHMIVEHKYHVDDLQSCIPEDRKRELLGVICKLHRKINVLDVKAKEHRRYVHIRQCVENLRERVEEQVRQTEDENRGEVGRYKTCQVILTQLPLMRKLCDEAAGELQNISQDLKPSQLTAEQGRIEQNLASLHTWEMTVNNNLRILEWGLLKEAQLPSERRATLVFLGNIQRELQRRPTVEPTQESLDQEHWRMVTLQKITENRLRVLEILENKKGTGLVQSKENSEFMDLKQTILNEFELQMASISQARASLRDYTGAVSGAMQFLHEAEDLLLPPLGSVGSCPARLRDIQQALASMKEQHQSHVSQLQAMVPQHDCLCPQRMERLHGEVLSQVLVRMSTLQANVQLDLEALQRCAEYCKKFSSSHEEICQRVESTESRLSNFLSCKVTCLKDCTDQQAVLKSLSEEVDSLTRLLTSLAEWCSEPGCRCIRVGVVSALWWQVARLQCCTRGLKTRSEQRTAEWIAMTTSVEHTAVVMEQLEADLPTVSREKVCGEELQELLQHLDQFQDRLDCEHRALSALELRIARLLGVPAHQEQAPLVLLCQQLQAMQTRYGSLKEKSMLGRCVVRTEMEDREKVREELSGVKAWLLATDHQLSQLEQSPSTKQLQEVHTQLCNQKAVLLRITGGLRRKYSDMHTLVPVEMDGPLQEVTCSLQEVGEKVRVVMEKSGPLHKLGPKLSLIRAGLESVQDKMQQRSHSLLEAESTQKLVWDELDMWHSSLASLEVEVQDMEQAVEAQIFTESLVDTQVLHSHMAKQAEQRTAFLSKICKWFQEHEEMIHSSKTWLSEAGSWLTAPCAYTTAKDLTSYIHALQVVLDDSQHIRVTLQGFVSVLEDISAVCDVTKQREQLAQADRHVSDMQQSFVAPLSQLQHAAAEVDAIETEVKKMEKDATEVRMLLSSPETASGSGKKMTVCLNMIQSMGMTIEEIQTCKPGLCLPEKAEDTLVVFQTVARLQEQLLQLKGMIPVDFIVKKETLTVSAASPTTTTSISEISSALILKTTTSLSEISSTASPTTTTSHSEIFLAPSPKTTTRLSEISSAPIPVTTTSPLEISTGHSPTTTSLSEFFLAPSPTPSTSLTEMYSTPSPTPPPFLPEMSSTPSPTPPTFLPMLVSSSPAPPISSSEETLTPSSIAVIFSTEKHAVPRSTILGTEEAEEMGVIKGQVQVAHLDEDVLKQSGATLMTVEEVSPEQRLNWGIDIRQESRGVSLPPEEEEEEEEEEEGGMKKKSSGGTRWWLVEKLLGRSPEDPEVSAGEEQVEAAGGRGTSAMGENQGQDTPEQDLNVVVTTGTSVSEALSEPTSTVRTESLSENMAPSLTGSCPTLGKLHACRERATQLEVWLERARQSLRVTDWATSTHMQDRVEQQLLMCQEMFLEMEQNVADLLGQQEEPSGFHQETVALSDKLQLLKSDLVTFQLLLQEKQSQEQVPTPSLTSPRRSPLGGRLQRSTSVQEMFSPSKSKLFRQSSFQQQKELEQELTEQRDLTKSIAQQGGRGRVHGPAHKDQPQMSLGDPVELESKGETASQKQWTHLHNRLLALAETGFSGGSSDVSDISVSWSDTSAYSAFDHHSLQEIQTHISQLRELGQTARDVVTKVVPVEEVDQKLDEGLFGVLWGVGLSLSTLTRLLQLPLGQSFEDAQMLQLETLSTELVTLGKELASQGSEVISVLGSDRGDVCVDHLGKLLPVVQSSLAARQNQLQAQVEKTSHQQTLLTALHAALVSNELALHKMTNEAVPQDTCNRLQSTLLIQEEMLDQFSQVLILQQEAEGQGLPSTLIQEATKLEGALTSALGSVRARCEELEASVDLQDQFESLLHGLERLVTLGSDHMSQSPGLKLQTRTELQKYLSRHSMFFQFLGIHLGTLHHLYLRVPESSHQKWEGSLTRAQEEVSQLQKEALEEGTRMEQTLQMWTLWEESRACLDSLLKDVETGLFNTHLAEDTEEQIHQKLSVYQKMKRVLDESRPRLIQVLVLGKRLQGTCGKQVRVSGHALEVRWRGLLRTLDNTLVTTVRRWKLLSRFSLDSLALNEWMYGARKSIDSLMIFTLTANQEQSLDQVRAQFSQYTDLTKELAVWTVLKTSVVATGTRLQQLGEEERIAGLCSIETQLRQIEQDWADMLSDIPPVQQTLHQLLMERLSPHGAMTELLAWIGETEARLEEQQNSGAELTQLHQNYQECNADMAVHQLTVDYVNQTAFQMITGRYEHIQYAEELGTLNNRWLSLQRTLNNLEQDVDEQQRICKEREVTLQDLRNWICSQREWMDSAQRPVSLSGVETCLKKCEDLKVKIIRNISALQELKENYRTKKEEGNVAFLTQTDELINACEDLTEQNVALEQRLNQVLEVWTRFEKGLDDPILTTVKTSQAIQYICFPQLSLQALQGLHNKLQCLRKETAGCDSQWAVMSQTVSLLEDTVSSSALLLLSEQLDRERARWTKVNSELEDNLLRSQTLLQVWEAYSGLSVPFSQCLQTLKADARALTSRPPGQDNAVPLVAAQILVVQSLQERADSLQADLERVLKASKELSELVEASAAIFIRSESRHLTRDVLHLNQTLADHLGHLKDNHERLQEFESVLESLEKHLEVWDGRLKDATVSTHIAVTKSALLELGGFSSDLDVLNETSYRLTLSDSASHRLQSLNRSWAKTSACATDTCSELQTETLRQQSFQEKCESWTDFLQTMDDSLAVDLASTYAGLREQLRTHQRFQLEMYLGHQTLHAVIRHALDLLQMGDVDDRTDFILKLAQLKEHWQGVVQRAAQRRSLVEGLVKHWHLYHRNLRKLQRFVADAQALLPPTGPARCSLQQLRHSLHDLKHTELLFQRYQCSYIQILDVGRQLFSMGDEQTQTQLQNELATLQDNWENLPGLLERRRGLTELIIQNWEHCQTKLSASMQQLSTIQTRLKKTILECNDELQVTEKLITEAENFLDDWADSLTELATMKTDLSQYIIADDMLLLQEQVDYLHCEWEDLCLKVSQRKQEIADRLNAWTIFNDKNKELCDWLTQMENKVAHNADLSIEEMVEKLKKDCMEEINLFSENKTHLKQLGEQLITASNKTKGTEVNDKLKDINDRWQHLFDHIEARVRKLKETLVTVQQLDKNMSNLRTWLSRMEAELSKPVVYSICHSDEIQRKLTEQQDLQRDIELHTEGVASVLTLCDVLLHDADACGSDMENDSIQQTTRSLDRRWRNICAMSMERRIRIEETWRLWCKFQDDYSRFEDWLKTAERTAANPVSVDVLYTCAKEELKKFEAFQRQVHERLTQLELVNKQYRRLARENRTDAASKLKAMVHEGNQRWDNLQKRVAIIIRRLKYFTSQREDFEGTREGILVWLTEMDLQLTNVEHFSESDIEDKMRQLNGFQQEITLNTDKIDALIVFGENLIQKSAPLDAVLIEDELEELHSYCQEVFGRVARFHHRLTNRYPVLEEERDTDLDDTAELTGGSWGENDDEEKEEDECRVGVESLGRQAACHLLAHPLERSGRETPVSVDSIPLEWDHTVDVGGSSSHEDEDDATFYSAMSVKSLTDPPSWHSPEPQEMKRVHRDDIGGLSSSPRHPISSSFHQQGYTKLLSECSGTIDSVKRVKLILDDEELEDQGLTTLTTADKQTGVIERWELFQAQARTDQLCIQQDRQQKQELRQKLNSDLTEITSWLSHVLPELGRLQRLTPATNIRDLEGNIRRLKEMQRTFNSHKSLMISINLRGQDLQAGGIAELQEIQEGLRTANHRWTQACAGLDSWEEKLHSTLMQCQEFHETLHSMLLWLSQAENTLRAINIHDPSARRPVLLEHRDVILSLEEELRGRQRHVSSLQEISSQLLLRATAEDSMEAKEKVHVIGNKLRLLLRQASNNLHILQDRLESGPTSSERHSVGPGMLSAPLQKDMAELGAAAERPAGCRKEEKGACSPARPFFYRVLRAAFPLHLLLLLLLLLACLVPHSEEDYSCTLSNNFARSFYPMLRYTNGPPPT
ncbi:hypothetical protein DPEC_G00292250 [Dallia pectoralis]|uniref:Uncharacterized protein n=1 Tax=Dallia pectoralis TaxID=75939 RepID=A0ACC2FHU9_DALPE|nr:hypothetical protein DPEC_G00292250 [Dallia pectoralis]